MKKTVAIVGSNGIPACYGGFETLAERLVVNLRSRFNFIVYCSNIHKKGKKRSYLGARLIHLPFRANGAQSIFYDIVSTIHAWVHADIILVLGPAAGFVLPLTFFFRKRLIVNHGGLNEWEREKYPPIQRLIIRFNHWIAAKSAAINIADNHPLATNIQRSFGRRAIVIEYGGDHVLERTLDGNLISKYPFLAYEYILSVSRAQVDNNLHVLLESFSSMPGRNLVIVSNWQISKYGRDLLTKYQDCPNLHMIPAVYDSTELDSIRNNAILYIHSHSRCGTAPSLVEAMNYGLPIICWDVETNRCTTEGKSQYFSSSEGLRALINNLKSDDLRNLGSRMKEIAQRKYKWTEIANKYAEVFEVIK